MASSAAHSAESDDWGTPVAVVEFARHVLGDIDYDSCSSDYWNHHTVKAKRFYTAERTVLDGLLVGRVLCNPPGGKVPGTQRSLPKAVWEHHVDAWRRGAVDGVVWIGYSLEQLVSLQGSPAHPLQFATLVPAARLSFLQRDPNGGPPKAAGQPTHGNYVTLLHSQRSPSEAKAQMARFRDGARALDVGGALVRPM